MRIHDRSVDMLRTFNGNTQSPMIYGTPTLCDAICHIA